MLCPIPCAGERLSAEAEELAVAKLRQPRAAVVAAEEHAAAVRRCAPADAEAAQQQQQFHSACMCAFDGHARLVLWLAISAYVAMPL